MANNFSIQMEHQTSLICMHIISIVIEIFPISAVNYCYAFNLWLFNVFRINDDDDEKTRPSTLLTRQGQS
jgi:hypothetical protein